MPGLNSAVAVENSDTRTLLELAQAGDAEAYGQLYRFYATRLLRHAIALSGSVTQAEELAQDTLVEAWLHLRRYDGRCQFFTWLCAILLNRYRNTLRANRVFPFSALAQREQAKLAHAMENVLDRSFLPDKTAELHDQSAFLRKCIDALPARHQQVIFLRFYVEDSLEGIAAALGCSVGTVKSRLFHALEKLRSMKALNPKSHLQSL